MNKILNYISDQFVFWNLKKITKGYLQLTDSKGKEYFFGDSKSFLKARLKINDPSFCFNILRKGSSGLAESYMKCEFETEDLTSLIELGAKNINIIYKFSGFFQFSLLQSFLKRNILGNTKDRSKKNISLHYDLGNEFFSKWLDKTLTYSCGIFNSSNETLEKAQINKYNKLINMVKPKRGDKILEIGCGWGGFSSYVAKNFRTKIIAITNSKEQFEYTSRMISNEGLNEKVTVELKDYRDINGKYDYISSIEMFEAVGQKYWPVFFEKIKNCLNDSGLATLQIITISEDKKELYQKNQDFIQQYIFPGGVLPSKKQIFQTAASLGLKLNEFNSFGNSYANTLNIWNEKFQNAWHLIAEQGYSIRFKRMWEYYLSYCEAGFKSKNLDLIQF